MGGGLDRDQSLQAAVTSDGSSSGPTRRASDGGILELEHEHGLARLGHVDVGADEEALLVRVTALMLSATLLS